MPAKKKPGKRRKSSRGGRLTVKSLTDGVMKFVQRNWKPALAVAVTIPAVDQLFSRNPKGRFSALQMIAIGASPLVINAIFKSRFSRENAITAAGVGLMTSFVWDSIRADLMRIPGVSNVLATVEKTAANVRPGGGGVQRTFNGEATTPPAPTPAPAPQPSSVPPAPQQSDVQEFLTIAQQTVGFAEELGGLFGITGTRGEPRMGVSRAAGMMRRQQGIGVDQQRSSDIHSFDRGLGN